MRTLSALVVGSGEGGTWEWPPLGEGGPTRRVGKGTEGRGKLFTTKGSKTVVKARAGARLPPALPTGSGSPSSLVVDSARSFERGRAGQRGEASCEGQSARFHRAKGVHADMR